MARRGPRRWDPDAKVALVIGAGDATGRRHRPPLCARGLHGLRHAPHGRQAGAAGRAASRARAARRAPSARDARKEEQMVALVETIEREVGPIEVAVFNIGANVRFPIRETTARVYFKVWEMALLRRLPDGRARWPRSMVPRGRGTILFTGATASVRGGVGLLRLRRRQARAARAGAEHGARAGAAGHPRRARRHRRRHRHRVHPQQFPRARTR